WAIAQSKPTERAKRPRTRVSITVSPQTPRKPTYPHTPTPLPSTPVSPASSPKFGNPTPVGLCGFLLANTPATIMLLGWGGAGGNNGNQSAAIGAYFYLGCLLEIICGIGEWINGETFNATVFLVLGGYFGASAAVMVPFYNAVSGYGSDVDAAEAAYYASYATFLIFMAVVLLFFTIASVRLDICHVVLFACFTVCFPCEAITYFYMADGNDSAAHTFRVCSGVSSLAGSAILLGSLLEAVDFPYLLPVGDLRKYVKGRSEKLDRRRHKTSMSCKL
ncbi:hypothetical protein D0859_05247, partial [Hortaea werneckii]